MKPPNTETSRVRIQATIAITRMSGSRRIINSPLKML